MSESQTQPGSGVMRDGCHVFPIRVYYEDTDAAGVVYYANYLRFAERARTEMLRLVAEQPMRAMAADGAAFVVRRCALDYRAPAHLDESIEVRSRLVAAKGATLVARQTVMRAADVLVEIDVEVACMTRAGRPTRVPAALRDALTPFTHSRKEPS
ncbi:MAG: tol-pal system-associated acyl-CoA thioesterase [Alphaproteobacteria bacterium]|nr:tol-pal system-associated acyl-CoA thioesterase [Alphaproteobacteria bacterium]